MPDSTSNIAERSRLRQLALSRWENEGGSTSSGPQTAGAVPPLTDAELVQLRVRVIALENLVIALLAEASDRELDLVREMAGHISPRPGFTPHRLTVQAASEMIDLLQRSMQFRAGASSHPDGVVPEA